MNYFNLSSSTAFLYSLYKYLCCREKVEGDLYEGGLYDGGDYEEGVYEEKMYPTLNCKSITPTNTPHNTNLHSRYQSKKFTFNL
jgi:hypothetical protein